MEPLQRYTFYLFDFSFGLFVFMLLSVGYNKGHLWAQVMFINGRSLFSIEWAPDYGLTVYLFWFEFVLWLNPDNEDLQRFR